MVEQFVSYFNKRNDKEVDLNNNSHIKKLFLRDNDIKPINNHIFFTEQKNNIQNQDLSNISPILLPNDSKHDLPIKILSSDKINNISISSISGNSKKLHLHPKNKNPKKTVIEEGKTLRSLILHKTKNFLRANSTTIPHKKLSNSTLYPTRNINNNNNVFMTSKNINFNNKLNNKKINKITDNKKYFLKKQRPISNSIIPQFNPLSIPEEDKIFSKMNRFYDTGRKKNKEKNIFDFSKENSKEFSLTERPEIKKKMNKTFYPKKKTKIDFDKEILNTLYMTDENYYDQLNKIKKSKNKFNLENYQGNLLDFIQPTISTNGFRQLKNQLSSIKKQADVPICNYREQIKNIEDDEEKIINNINFFYDHYMKDKNRLTDYFQKHSLKYLDVQLPSIKFIRVVKSKLLRKYKDKL